MIEEFIKLTFIQGLQGIVTTELSDKLNVSPLLVANHFILVDPNIDINDLLKLKSVTNIFIVKHGEKIHPSFISNHKSLLMDMIEKVLGWNKNKMKSYHISCAGDDSPEIKSIKSYIESQYKIIPDPENPDLKIHIGKNGTMWEAGVEVTPRPLSQRDYKITHIKGGINPTVAYAINSLCDVKSKSSYLNVCSGSATLLIEAAHINPELKLIGFDNSKDHISLAIQNLREAKLLRSVELKFLDLLDQPDLGTFDTIVSDLPFGMHIGKGDDLEKLYSSFLEFSEKSLNPSGTLAVYTTESTLFESLLKDSTFEAIETINLKIVTNVNSYIYPKIYICEFASK